VLGKISFIFVRGVSLFNMFDFVVCHNETYTQNNKTLHAVVQTKFILKRK